MDIYFFYKKLRPKTKRRRIKWLVLRINREFESWEIQSQVKPRQEQYLEEKERRERERGLPMAKGTTFSSSMIKL
jgi:hypothetical protein